MTQSTPGTNASPEAGGKGSAEKQTQAKGRNETGNTK